MKLMVLLILTSKGNVFDINIFKETILFFFFTITSNAIAIVFVMLKLILKCKGCLIVQSRKKTQNVVTKIQYDALQQK